MFKLGLVILISLLAGNNYAQDYFVLLQSDNRQPFYVRLGNQVYSSSSAGHLILSRLKDSTYTLAIGFSSQPGVEQTYSLTGIHNDQELQIREHGQAGWGLYDSQTNGWLPMLSSTSPKEAFRAIGTRRDDAFSRLMAGVVRDTAVLYNDFAVAGLVTDSTAAAMKNSTATHPVTTITSDSAVDSAVAAVAPVTPMTTPSGTRDSAAAPVTSLTTPSRIRDSAAVAARPFDSLTRPLDSRPLDSGTTAISRNSDSSVTTIINSDPLPAKRSDSTAAANVLYRPVSGSPSHKAPPVADSPTRGPLFRPVPSVSKLSQIRMTRNMRLVYALRDKEGNKADTVVVIIPLDSAQTGSPKKANTDSARLIARKPLTIVGPVGSTPADSSRPATIRPRPSASDSSRSSTAKTRPAIPDTGRGKRGANTDTQSSVHTIVPTPINQPADKTHNDSIQKPKPAAKTTLPYINSDCHNFATDYDVDKLRVKMLEGAREEDRVSAALKVFKTKCFYTRQIRALSEVFTTDAAKYRFFETAYPFAADEHFRELGALLTDPVFANKFKTLTGGR